MPVVRKFALGMFSKPGQSQFCGAVLDDHVVPASFLLPSGTYDGRSTLSSLLEDWPSVFDSLKRSLAGSGYEAARDGEAAVPLGDLSVHMPLSAPRQIICTGANYKKHVIDLAVAMGAGADTEGMTQEERRAHVTRRVESRSVSGIPYAFSKLVSSLCGPYDDVMVPHDATQFDWELELGVVLARDAWRVSRQNAANYIAGYVIVNDLTRRELIYRQDLKALGTDWLRAKSSPGFMPTGPYFVPAEFVAEPQNLQIQLKLNNDIMQDESTSDMIFDIARQIEYVSASVKLLAGDLLATGSPAGNGVHYQRFLQAGDILEGSIEGLGVQRNRVIAEEMDDAD